MRRMDLPDLLNLWSYERGTCQKQAISLPEAAEASSQEVSHTEKSDGWFTRGMELTQCEFPTSV